MTGWRVHPIRKGLQDWCGDWDRLNHELYNGHPLFDSRFVESLLEFYGTGQEYLLVFTKDGRTSGLTVLTRHRFGIWASFLPSQLQAAPLLVARTEDIAGIFSALPLSAWQVSFLCQDPRFSPFRLECQAPMAFSQIPHALTMNIDARGKFEAYWQARSKNLKRNIRRYRSRTEREGYEISIERITRPVELGPAVARYGDLESAGWKGRQGTAISACNKQGEFYRKLMEEFASSGQAEVYEYYLNDELAASRLIISNSDIKVILKTAYDETKSRYSPGKILLFEILQQEISPDADYGSIEFYTDASEEQLRWCSEDRWIYHVNLYRYDVLRKLHHLYSLRHLPRASSVSRAE